MNIDLDAAMVAVREALFYKPENLLQTALKGKTHDDLFKGSGNLSTQWALHVVPIGRQATGFNRMASLCVLAQYVGRKCKRVVIRAKHLMKGRALMLSLPSSPHSISTEVFTSLIAMVSSIRRTA